MGEPASPKPTPALIAATAAETLGATALALVVSIRGGFSLVWILLPLAILSLTRRSFSEHALDLELTPPPLRTHVRLGAALLLGYAALHAAFMIATGHTAVRPAISSGLALTVVQELLVVAVPEEIFFRGYLQTRWDRVLGRPWEIAGARVGPGIFVQAVVFALCHLATGDWTRLRVFFFGLLAGWLRTRSGSILPPAIYHAVANVWFRLLLASFV